jgi:hypothetical protein
LLVGETRLVTGATGVVTRNGGLSRRATVGVQREIWRLGAGKE